MNKSELISHIAEGANLSKEEAKRALNAFIDGVVVTLKKGEQVTIVGFGTFKTSHRNARVGRNPQTGAKIEIPASIAATFKAGKDLKDAVNNS